MQLVVSDAHAGLKTVIAQVLAARGNAARSNFLRETLGRRAAASSSRCSRRCCGRFSAQSSEQAGELGSGSRSLGVRDRALDAAASVNAMPVLPSYCFTASFRPVL